MKKQSTLLLSLTSAFLLFIVAACMRTQPEVIVITATFLPPAETAAEIQQSPVPDQQPIIPTSDPTRPVTEAETPREHTVQSGDTLYGIATRYNLSLNTLIAANDIANPDILTVGQVIQIPGAPDQQTNGFKIIPDGRLVRGPGSSSFDIAAFINQQPGHIRIATDEVTIRLATGSGLNETLAAAQIIERVSLNYSVDARLLLALLEYSAGWLSNPNLPDELQAHPLISEEASAGFDRSGLYKQLTWAANELNKGYYGWRYRGWTALEFNDGLRLRYAPGLNAGTVAIQYFLSRNDTFDTWAVQIAADGFYSTYFAYFGDPFIDAVEPLVPPAVQQPLLTLPFNSGETWYFTGGAHGGWGSGSAWSAIDFAPPDDREDGDPFCYISEHWTTAIAPGIIARSERGVVVLDLDGDGDEATGWTIVYLHLATTGRVPAGTQVDTGDNLGRPSCEGGFSTATHMHIARRYNGEWIPVYCHQCAPGQERPPLVISDWTVIGLQNQEYEGYMEKDGEQRIANQGRTDPANQLSW